MIDRREVAARRHHATGAGPDLERSRRRGASTEFQELALWLLRDARDPVRLLQNFGAWASTLVEVQRAPAGIDAFSLLLTYMFRVVGEANRAKLQTRIRQMSQHAEETEMSSAKARHARRRPGARWAERGVLLQCRRRARRRARRRDERGARVRDPGPR